MHLESFIILRRIPKQATVLSIIPNIFSYGYAIRFSLSLLTSCFNRSGIRAKAGNTTDQANLVAFQNFHEFENAM